jgi:hypothetical protein
MSYYPETTILIENRSGSIYSGGKFLISKGRDLRSLCEYISASKLNLKITLDIPQLLTAYGGPQKLKAETLDAILHRQNTLQTMTEGIHLWGKKRSEKGRLVAHFGDLNSYFEDQEKKEIFLEWLKKFLNDGNSRYFVPEVNSSNEDLHSIVADIERKKIKFVNTCKINKNL